MKRLHKMKKLLPLLFSCSALYCDGTQGSSFTRAYVFSSSNPVLYPPNAGITIRQKMGHFGISGEVSYDFMLVQDYINYSGNLLGYLSSGPESFYLSVGLTHGEPLNSYIQNTYNEEIEKAKEFSLPIRVGLESSYGFSDVGVSLFRFHEKVYAFPEIRGGLGFTF